MSLSPDQIRTQLASQAIRLRALEIAVEKLDPSFRTGFVPAPHQPTIIAAPAVPDTPVVAVEPQPEPVAVEAAVAPPTEPDAVAERQNLAGALLALKRAEEEERAAATMQSSPPPAVEFMEPQEAHGGAMNLPPAAEPEAPRQAVSLEERLGANWLLRIGGVLVLIGAAFFAALIQTQLTPLLRVASGFGFAGLMGAGGWWLARRNQMAGRTLQVIGLSLAYFISFASGFFAQTKVFGSFVLPAAMMIAFAGAMVIAAERWRSQFVAVFGFMLAIISVLAGAALGTQQIYSLGAIAIISLSAGILLLRNQWVQLTMLAILGIYATMPVMWILGGLASEPAAFSANFAAVLGYHLIFAAAFWRWGRVWVARERMYERELAEGNIPSDTTLPALPYSRAFAVVNSLALVALTVVALQLTRIYWSLAHYLFFFLAVLELGRLAIPTFRRTGLAAFHTALASGLITAGVMSALDGLGESIALAIQALIVVIAGTRTPQLRWLTPFAIIPAILATFEFKYVGVSTSVEIVGAFLTPLMLFAAAMPWRRYWTQEAPASTGTVAYPLSSAARLLISAIATGLFGLALGQLFVPGRTGNEVFKLSWAFLLFANLFLYASVFFRIRTWQLPAAVYTLASLACAAGTTEVSPIAGLGAIAVQVALYSIAWDVLGRRVKFPLKVLYAVFWAGVTVAAVAVCSFMIGRSIWSNDTLVDAGINGNRAFVFMGMSLAALATRLYRRSKLNVAGAVEEEADTSPVTHYLSLSFFMVCAFALVAIAYSFQDAETNPMSSIVISAIAFTLWFFEGRRTQRSQSMEPLMMLGLVVGSAGVLIYTDFALLTITGLVVFGIGMLLLSLRMKRFESALVAVTAMVALTGIALGASRQVVNFEKSQALAGLASALIILGSAPLLRRIRVIAPPSHTARGIIDVLEVAGNALATVLALVLLSSGAILSGKFITVAWGLLAVGLLVGGFLFNSRTMRYGAMAIFALSIGRVVLYDLAGSDLMTKVIAFIGLGILLIVAGVAYGVLSKKFLREPKPAQEQEIGNDGQLPPAP